MRKYKKLLALVLAAAMLLALAACGSSSSSSEEASASEETAAAAESAEESEEPAEAPAEEPESAEEPEEEPAEEAPAEAPEAPAPAEEPETSAGEGGYVSYSLPLTEEKQTITIYSCDWFGFLSSYFETYADTEFWQDLGESLNVDFKFTIGSEDQVMLIVASGEVYDVIYNLGMYYSGGDVQALADGYVVDLNAYQDELPNYNAFLDSDATYRKQVTTDEGQISSFYGFNVNIFPDTGLWIRDDYMSAAGFDTMPQTVDEYHELLLAIENYSGEPPLWIGYSGGAAESIFGSAYGVNTNYNPGQSGAFNFMYYVDGSEIRFSPYEEGFREYLTLMNEFWDENLIYKDFMTGTNIMGADEDAIKSGVAVTTRSVEQYNEIVDWSESTWTASYYPVLNEGDTMHMLNAANGAAGGMWYIVSASPNTELTMQIFDYMFTPEGQIISSYGFEGKSMSYAADGSPELDIDIVYNNENFNPSGAHVNYFGVMKGVSIYDYDVVRLGYDDSQQNALDVWSSNADNECYYPSSGPALTTEETEIYNATANDLFTYISECVPKFILGDMNLDSEYDAFVEQIRALGGDTLLDLYQASYDRYMAR